MQRCNNVYNNIVFRERMAIIKEKEKDRKFCRHSISHALDVARIGYIMILEKKLDIDKELFYTAALLHDAGRYSGVAHNISGANLARAVMPECGFSYEETELVYNAILGHRNNTHSDIFSDILYDADKKSRLCSRCQAQDECYWDSEKRNMDILI